jgi:hypothetical protein
VKGGAYEVGAATKKTAARRRLPHSQQLIPENGAAFAHSRFDSASYIPAAGSFLPLHPTLVLRSLVF